MQIEVFSDVVCPFCYIGKRRLEEALDGFGHADQVTVTYRSFQLDPSQPRRPRSSAWSRCWRRSTGRACSRRGR